VSCKLKRLKSIFKEKSREIVDVSVRAKERKAALDACQRLLDLNHSEMALRHQKKHLLAEYSEAATNEEIFFKSR
ncbi:unnamed protein product, partial [Ilex paraguariensis]